MKTNGDQEKDKDNALIWESIEKMKTKLVKPCRTSTPTEFKNRNSVFSDDSGRSVGWNAYFEGRNIDARIPQKYIEKNATFAVLLHFDSLLINCKLPDASFRQWITKLHWMPFEVYLYLFHKFVHGFEDIHCTGYQRSLLIDLYILRQTTQHLVKKDNMLKSLDKIEKRDIMGYTKVTSHSTAIALCMPTSIPQFLVLLHLVIIRLKVGYTTVFYSCIKDACRNLPCTFRAFWERVCPALDQYLCPADKKAILKEKEKHRKTKTYWVNETSFDELPIAKALLAHAEQADRLTYLVEQNYQRDSDQQL